MSHIGAMIIVGENTDDSWGTLVFDHRYTILYIYVFARLKSQSKVDYRDKASLPNGHDYYGAPAKDSGELHSLCFLSFTIFNGIRGFLNKSRIKNLS